VVISSVDCVKARCDPEGARSLNLNRHAVQDFGFELPRTPSTSVASACPSLSTLTLNRSWLS